MKLIILLSMDRMNELIGAKLRFGRLPLEEHDRGFAGLHGFSDRTTASCSAWCIFKHSRRPSTVPQSDSETLLWCVNPAISAHIHALNLSN